MFIWLITKRPKVLRRPAGSREDDHKSNRRVFSPFLPRTEAQIRSLSLPLATHIWRHLLWRRYISCEDGSSGGSVLAGKQTFAEQSELKDRTVAGFKFRAARRKADVNPLKSASSIFHDVQLNGFSCVFSSFIKHFMKCQFFILLPTFLSPNKKTCRFSTAPSPFTNMAECLTALCSSCTSSFQGATH